MHDASGGLADWYEEVDEVKANERVSKELSSEDVDVIAQAHARDLADREAVKKSNIGFGWGDWANIKNTVSAVTKTVANDMKDLSRAAQESAKKVADETKKLADETKKRANQAKVDFEQARAARQQHTKRQITAQMQGSRKMQKQFLAFHNQNHQNQKQFKKKIEIQKK